MREAPRHVVIDLTNSPHVPFFAPLVKRLHERGARVSITARCFAQTVELAELFALDVTVIGAHGGSSRLGKARAAVSRTRALKRHVRALDRELAIDVAISHGSTDLPMVSRRLGIPHVTVFDYEWATTMHRLNCRNSWKVVTPDAIDPARRDEYGAPGKLVQYPGLKEDYYLADALARTSPEADVVSQLGISSGDVLVVLRPPPELALYHRGHANDVFAPLLARAARQTSVTAVVLARTPEQRIAIEAQYAGEPSIIIPAHAIDAISLLSRADLMVSAGGTMNREAVALGVPVYTVFAGRLGGVDEQLLASNRLRRLERADDVIFARREKTGSALALRDPDDLLDLLLQGLPVGVRMGQNTDSG
ncbi:MAG: DUF354 domain-containing protein [Thermoleophilia bacterium]|nr:DUF354 domain-containing protein [Thermoleophilia bacterium]